jgi:hypothetical protein
VASLNELRKNLIYKIESQAGPVHAPIFRISVVVSNRTKKKLFEKYYQLFIETVVSTITEFSKQQNILNVNFFQNYFNTFSKTNNFSPNLG